MRKIGIVFAVVFVMSWMFSLFCMHAAGQAGGTVEEENGSAVSGSSVWDGYGQTGLERSVSGQVAGWNLNGDSQDRGKTAGWNGNSHSADQGDGASAPELNVAGQQQADQSGTDSNVPDQQANQGEPDSAVKTRSRRIILERYGIRTYLSVEDYLPGVMVCQTGPEMGLEALKCQAVTARTYIYRQMGEREEIQEEELDLDYLGDYTAQAGKTLTVHQKEELAKRLEQCRQAAEATAGTVMKYEDRYILPLFHERSAGRTRNGEADYPYLQSVESKWDVAGNDGRWTSWESQQSREQESESGTGTGIEAGAATGTEKGIAAGVSETSFSLSEFAQRIKNLSDAPSLDPDRLSSEIQVVKRDDAGYVLQIKIGPRTYTGDDVQYALDLPSTCFTMDLKTPGRISVTAKGRGHGYGLSQNGAQAMAEEGWSYTDILKYYYKNIVIVTE